MSCTIPKHFNFIWIGPQIPERFQGFYDGWKSKHPQFQFTLWDEDEILKEPELVAALRKIRSVYETETGVLPIKRISIATITDIIRYYIMYKHGGIYADMDMECIKPIDKLHTECQEDCKFLFAGEVVGTPLVRVSASNNNFIIAPPNHKFFQDIFESAVDRILYICQFFKDNGYDDTHPEDGKYYTKCKNWETNPASVCGPWWINEKISAQPEGTYTICPMHWFNSKSSPEVLLKFYGDRPIYARHEANNVNGNNGISSWILPKV